MSVSIYMKGYYEELFGFGRRKNKANSKPNKANSGCVGGLFYFYDYGERSFGRL